MRSSLALVALGLLTLLVMELGPERAREPDRPDETRDHPSFVVEVEKPRSARPLFGILSESLESRLLGGELRFDQDSPGARIAGAGPGRLELQAEGWDVLLASLGEGRIDPATRLVFVVPLGNRRLPLRCRPGRPAVGRLEMPEPTVPQEPLSGSFAVELAECENAETGKAVDWPASPLVVRGRFAGLHLAGFGPVPARSRTAPDTASPEARPGGRR